MLAAIRKYSNSPIAKTLLFILAIAFVSSFGLFQVVRKLLGKDYAIKVGSRKISPEMLRCEKNRIINRQKGLSESANETTDKNFVLQKIIYESIVDLAAEDFGFIISDTTIKQYISDLYMFRDKNGVFNASLFRAFLRKIHVPENLFMEFLKNDIKISLMKLPLSYISVINALYPYACAQLENRTLTVVEIDPSSLAITQVPIDSELESFYSNHKEKFMIEETRSFTLLELKESLVKDKIVVPEQEIKDVYETSSKRDNKSYEESRIEIVEELRQEKLPSAINDITRQIEDDLMSGMPLPDVASKFNLTITKIENVVSNPTANDQSKFAGINYKEDALAVAFSMDDGTDSSFSEALDASGKRVQWVIHLDSIVPKHVEQFNVAKEKVMSQWIKQKQREKAIDVAKELQKKASLTSLERVAQQTGCYVTPKFDRRGKRADQEEQKDKDNGKEVAKNMEESDKAASNNTAKNAAVANEHKVKEDVKDKFSDIISELYQDAFKMQLSDIKYKKIGGKFVVYQIKEIVPAISISEKENSQYQAKLTQELVADLQQQLVNYLSKTDYPIKTNENVLQDALAGNANENVPSVPMDIF
jgi:hypothetical protein